MHHQFGLITVVLVSVDAANENTVEDGAISDNQTGVAAA